MKTSTFILSAALALPFAAHAQHDVVSKDTAAVPNTKEVKNRNVLLNASAENRPRQISIGLPAGVSATIFEDGLPVTYDEWPGVPYFYWTAMGIHDHIGLSSISESAITNGTVNYTVLSTTRRGSEKFEGRAAYNTNIYGLQRFDIALSGPIGKGWSYTAGMYVNHDPGTIKLEDADIADKMEIFKAGLTKTWHDGKGVFSLLYKHVNTRLFFDNIGPYYYVGDGTSKEYPGFKLGRDNLMPNNGRYLYFDVVDGEYKDVLRLENNANHSNDLLARLDYEFDNGVKLYVSSKVRRGNLDQARPDEMGIDDAKKGDGFTYAYDAKGHKVGEEYTGKYLQRYLSRDKGFESTWMTTAELSRASARHSWRTGMNFWWGRSFVNSSAGTMVQTLEKSPVWLLQKGKFITDCNWTGEYMDMHEEKAALYASDDWQATDRLWLSGGLRMEYYGIGGLTPMAYMKYRKTGGVAADHPENLRKENWSIKDGKLIDISKKWINPAAAINGRYTLLDGFGVTAEYVFAMRHPYAYDFAGEEMPNLDPVNIHLGRAGIFWNNSWLQLASQLSFVRQTNYKWRVQFNNPKNETDFTTVFVNYDVQTIGWTTDMVLQSAKGFTFHALFTLQDPRYKNYEINPTFKDGSTSHVSFSDKKTVGISDMILELNPSYTYDRFNIWLSARYSSAYYINKLNTFKFNGLWTTFAGVSYALNKNVDFSVNFVNLLNVSGASGGVSTSDLKPKNIENYLAVGGYIRPFTVSFGAKVKF